MATAPHPDRQIGALLELAPAGFAIALHVRFTRPAILVQAYPQAWTEIYSARGYVMQDPTVAWGFENTGSIRWTDLADRDEGGVLAAAATHGMRFGLTHVIDEGESRTLASFARSDREFAPDEVTRIEALVDGIHGATLATRAFDPATRRALAALPVKVTQG